MKMDKRKLATLVGALLLTCGAACAENLPDPTRPPAAVENPSGEPVSEGLQSIIRRDKGKPAAVINGEYVVLGGKVGDATLVEIGEDFVTLKSATGTETLRLLPGIEKTPASRSDAGKGARAANSDKKVTK